MAVNGVEIEVGQVWATRGGQCRRITDTVADSAYCFRLDDGETVTQNGKVGPTKAPQPGDLLKMITDNIRIPEPHTLFDAQPITMAAPGYESLANVLQMAYNQAAVGKGVERHAAVGEPFDRQVMQIGATKFGVGALLFQAFKKSEESQRLEHDRAVNELLGSIVYLAGAVIAMEKKRGGK